jgi:hypothetical protein
MKRILVRIWLTTLCFLLIGDVHAWEVPNYLRMSGGARMWFTSLQGDLIQKNRVKIDLIDNVGLKRDKLNWEFFADLRFANVHLLRFEFEPFALYDSRGDSYQKISNYRIGYDLDFFMTPQVLFGANVDLSITNYETRVKDVTIGDITYDYYESQSRTIPLIGIHGTYYPILQDIAIRPNLSSRVRWWNYESLETWDWEVAGAVDVPVNCYWTWSVNAGYRGWHTKTKRDKDTIDVNRTGFFVETSLMF